MLHTSSILIYINLDCLVLFFKEKTKKNFFNPVSWKCVQLPNKCKRLEETFSPSIVT